MKPPITKFEGEYRFLSNFYLHPIMGFASAEHAYQAQKAPYNVAFQRKIANSHSPSQAKSLGLAVNLRDDWEEKKLEVMMAILQEKFNDPGLKEKLLATEDAELVEGNWWHDTYWGFCTCSRHMCGANHLGKLLMQVRDRLKKERVA